MNIELQLTRLELSKKLESLGVKSESIFYWRAQGTNYKSWEISYNSPGPLKLNPVSAYSVAELGEILKIVRERDLLAAYGHVFSVGTSVIAPRGLQMCMSDANIGAKMLIYLIENGLYKIKE